MFKEKRANNLLHWIDYLATSSIIDEMLESYLLDEIEERAKALKNDKLEGLPDGFFCEICNDYAQYAEANQSDGTFICYSCRQ
jgi:hypothetical protein